MYQFDDTQRVTVMKKKELRKRIKQALRRLDAILEDDSKVAMHDRAWAASDALASVLLLMDDQEPTATVFGVIWQETW